MAESSSAGASALSALPSILSALQPAQKGTPMLMPSMTPEQYSLLNQMLGVSSGLSGLQGNTLGYMMQGGTAADYGPGAVNAYYQDTLVNPAMAELYNETIPSIQGRMSSKYWNSTRPNEVSKAQLANQTQLGKQYGQLVLANEKAKQQAQEESRTTGLNLLGQMQGQTLSAKPFDIVFQPKNGKGIMDFLKGHKGSLIGSLTDPAAIVGGVIGGLATNEKWETPFY